MTEEWNWDDVERIIVILILTNIGDRDYQRLKKIST